MSNEAENGIRKNQADRDTYTCPGELYSISHSIHLARLAAFYSKCRDCEHRFDHGESSAADIGSSGDSERRIVRTSLVTDESIRGVFLNELDRNRALAWGEAIAARLWDQQPLVARVGSESTAQIVELTDAERRPTRSVGPRIVVGFDERPSSPEIVTGLVLGLRMMGCGVIDLGQATLPMLAQQVHGSQADGGVFVTGAGGDVSITGFNLLAEGSIPFRPDELILLEVTAKTRVGRHSRRFGSHSLIQPQAAYEAALAPHFHALRPLRVVCGSSSKLMGRILKNIFMRLPCQLTILPLPTRKRDLSDPRDADLQRVAKVVMQDRHHLGVVIDEDGQHAAFITDRGKLVSVKEVARLLIEVTQRDNPAVRFVAATALWPDVQTWLSGRDASSFDGNETMTDLIQALLRHDAVFAIASDGRIWFRQPYPACDALLVLANILKALSLTDAPFSEVIDRISSPDNTPGS